MAADQQRATCAGIKAKAKNGELVITIPKTPSPVVPEVGGWHALQC